MSESRGSKLFAAMVNYFTRYIVFPSEPTPYQAEILTLWCLHTFVAHLFPICALAQVGATTKRSGKTLLMHCARLVCQRASDIFLTSRVMSLCRYIKHQTETSEISGRVTAIPTVFMDECERLASGAASDTRSMLAGSYKAGSVHMVATNKETFIFPTFGPKMFAQIGDVTDVLFDRCVPFEMRRSTTDPAFNFYGETLTAEGIAAGIVAEINAGGLDFNPAFVMPEFLEGRDREVFSPLWSVALSLGLNAGTMDKIQEAMVDLAASKNRKLRHFVNVEAEKAATDDGLGLRALRDAVSVLPVEDKTATGDIFSDELVARLKAIKLGPWRWVRGGPLTEKVLAGLLAGLAAGPSKSPVAMERGRGKDKRRGYNGDKLRAALLKAEGMGV